MKSKYALTPAVSGAKSELKGPVTLAMLPTVMEVFVTPGAELLPLFTITFALEQALRPTATMRTAASTPGAAPRRPMGIRRGDRRWKPETPGPPEQPGSIDSPSSAHFPRAGHRPPGGCSTLPVPAERQRHA